MNTVKLVIWDLDETFWEGTLSEGEVSNAQVELVKKLTQYGIVNSICSKNDFEQTKAKLEELGVWDYFVFPVISWNPKGEAIKNIITDCQLRSPNVVFIDDNKTNIAEVLHYNSEIITFSSVSDFLKELDWSNYNSNEGGKRLKQYKLLEEKKVYRNECSSNLEFLEKSNIRIQFIDDISAIIPRLAEMISRTNQLNYTKKRITEEELISLCKNEGIRTSAIKVIDNFGDYGICGFYAYNENSQELEHFLFSCRILNLGIEKYVYNKLGRPQINIIGPVSTELDEEKVTWIKEIKEDCSVDDNEKDSPSKKQIKIALLGGCDLDQICHYFNEDEFLLYKDFNYTGKNLNGIHREHTVYLRKTDGISDEEKEILFKQPFLDEKILYFHFLKENYDYLVFSPLMNYTQELYQHKDLGFLLSYGGYINVLEKDSVPGFSRKELESFKKEFEFVGQQSPEDFKKDLEWLLSKVSAKIIFLNGAEIEINNEKEIGALNRHIEMNRALEEFVNDHRDKCDIIDVRHYAKDIDDFEDNIRHYKRVVYISIAKEIINKCGVSIDTISKKSILIMKAKTYILKIKKAIAKLIWRY